MSIAVAQLPESGYQLEEQDLLLLHRCQERNEDAYGEIYRVHQQKVFNIAYRILGDRALAEDALQETFINIYRGIRFFRGDSKISTWINRIAVNVCLGLIRKNKRTPTLELDGTSETFQQSLESLEVGPFESYFIREHREKVQRALDNISHKHRTVVRMHDLEGHTIAEIAEHLAVPAGTVKSRLFYGRKEFKEHYARTLGHSSLN